MHTRLLLERFEDRTVPTNFTWDPTAAPDANGFYSWSDSANWESSTNTFPSNIEHIAIFNGASSTDNVKFDVANGTEIKSLVVESGYTGTIRLDDVLTLRQGGTLDAPAKIIPSEASANLIIKGSFTAKQGRLGPSNGVRSTIQIENNGSINFDLSQNVYLGMDVKVGNNNSSGKIIVYGDSDLAVGNFASITLAHPNSELRLDGNDEQANIVSEGLGGNSIVVEAGMIIRGGVGSMESSLPIKLTGAQSELEIRNNAIANGNASFRILSGGSPSTNGYSLSVKEGARVILGHPNANWGNIPTLDVAEEIVFDGGHLQPYSAEPTIIANSVQFIGESSVKQGKGSQFTNLIFALFGDDPKLFIHNATWNIRYKPQSNSSDSVSVQGTVVIAEKNTVLNTEAINDKQLLGTEEYDIIDAFAINGLFETYNKREQLPDQIIEGEIYRLGGVGEANPEPEDPIIAPPIPLP